MGDRCYMTLTCRRQDAPRFEALGFHPEFANSDDDDPQDPLAPVKLVDEEANYAHHGNLPTDVPWVGHSANGDSYGPSDYACDGRRLLDVATGEEGGYVVGWDIRKNQPNRKDLAAIRRFIAHEKRVNRLLKLKMP